MLDLGSASQAPRRSIREDKTIIKTLVAYTRKNDNFKIWRKI
jgi:hypothetical protein